MKSSSLVTHAVERLCRAFEDHDYNPTPVIDLGTLVASADGSIDAEEIDAIRQLLEPILHTQLDGEIVGYLVAASAKVIGAAGVPSRMRLLAQILLDCGAAEDGMILALAVAWSNGGYSDAEKKVIDELALATRLPAARVEALSEKVKKAVGAGGPESKR